MRLLLWFLDKDRNIIVFSLAGIYVIWTLVVLPVILKVVLQLHAAQVGILWFRNFNVFFSAVIQDYPTCLWSSYFIRRSEKTYLTGLFSGVYVYSLPVFIGSTCLYGWRIACK